MSMSDAWPTEDSEAVDPSLGQLAQHDRPAVRHSSSQKLLTYAQERKLFFWLRFQTLGAAAAELMRNSRLRVSLMALLSFIFWGGLLLVFLQGFEFVSLAYEEITHTVFNIFFTSLMVVLVFSSGLILYAGLYRSPETVFLLTTPTRPERIFLHKMQETIWFSSWGFLLLGSPLLIAFGVVSDAPWYYFLMLLPFTLAFVVLLCYVGAIVCFLLVWLVPKVRLSVTFSILCVSVLGFGLGGLWFVFQGLENELLTPRWFREVSGRLHVIETRLLPSWWLSSGLLEASRRSSGPGLAQPWTESVMFLAVLVSNALVLRMLAVGTARRLYRSSFSRFLGAEHKRRRISLGVIDRVYLTATWFLPVELQQLILKDLRIFRRDPVQWSQFVIFLGLLSLYFLNIRRFSYDINYVAYINMVGFLNVAVVALILSTFTTRFVYPMMSLEGRRFWILGLLPVQRSTILWGKFLFAAVGTIVPCTALVLASDLLLGIQPEMLLIHQFLSLVLCIGLAGLATGLGAMKPDLRQNCPAKIAAGFGGTLNLVLSATYILLVVVVSGYASHLYLVSPGSGHTQLLRLSLVGVTLLGLTVMWLPLHIGRKRFEQFEF